MLFLEKYKAEYGAKFAKDTIKMYIKNKGFKSVEEFIKQNPDMLTFDQNTKLLGIIRSHGYYVLSNEEYLKILEELKLEEQNERKLKTDNIETNIVNGHEIVTYTDEVTNEQTVIDNTVSNRDFKLQMEDVQKEHKQFNNSNKDNTQNLVNYMEENIKITPDKKTSEDIKIDSQDEEEQKIAMAIKIFEMDIGHPVDVDLNSKIIYDNGMIYSIEKRGESYEVIQQKSKKEHNKNNTLVKKLSNYPKAS